MDAKLYPTAAKLTREEAEALRDAPRLTVRTLEAGQFLDMKYHVADVHDGKATIIWHDGFEWDNEQIAEFGKRIRQARKLGKKRESSRSTCKPGESD